MNPKIKSGLSGLSIPATITKVRFTLGMFTGNPNFPNPPFPGTEVAADVDQLEVLAGQVTMGNKLNLGSRNLTLASVRKKMFLNSSYVNAVSAGSMPMLESSGFELVKQRTAAVVPEEVKNLRCVNLPQVGTCKMTWKGVKGRDYYQAQMTANPLDPESWKPVATTTKLSCVATGVTTGTRMFFRVCAVNHAGQGEWSEPAELMIR